MRLSVLRASLSRSAADIRAAETVMRRHYRPVFRAAESNAREHSGQLCEFHGEEDQQDMQALRRACEEDHDLARLATDFWQSRARLDLLMAADPVRYSTDPANELATGSAFVTRGPGEAKTETYGEVGSYDTAEWLLRSRALGQFAGTRLWLAPGKAELFALLRDRGAMHAARAVARPRGQETQWALDVIEEAVRLVPPDQAPTMFRLAAEEWLRVWDKMEPELRERWGQASYGRFAAYLRLNLAALDAVTLGERAETLVR